MASADLDKPLLLVMGVRAGEKMSSSRGLLLGALPKNGVRLYAGGAAVDGGAAPL